MNLAADLDEFLSLHRTHGAFTPKVGALTPNGYRLELACSCGVAIRARHYSRRTERAYVHWIKRYIFFYGKRHPAEMGASDVTAFLTALAVRDRVAASTQNQALNALLFLYREILGAALPYKRRNAC